MAMPQDTFEDAPDAASVRSLTQRKLSVARSNSESAPSEFEAAFKKVKGKAAAKPNQKASPEQESLDATSPALPETDSNGQQSGEGEEEEPTDKGIKSPAGQTQPPVVAPAGADSTRKSSFAAASSRLSRTSNEEDLDVVNLDDESSAVAKQPTKVVPTDRQSSPSPAATSSTKTTNPSTNGGSSGSGFNPKTLSLSSITQALPSMPWSPPATESPTKKNPPLPVQSHIPPPATAPAAPPGPPSRKLTSPFAWLSRSTTGKEASQPVSSPPAVSSPRRNTAASDATLNSNPEMMLSRLENGGAEASGQAPRSSSLRDRFKLVRMREEAGVTLPSDDEQSPAVRSSALGILSPASAHGPEDAQSVVGASSLSAVSPTSPAPKSPNPGLAPGTASGVEAGPSALSGVPVDWDLWQSVVYEGPAAVARTSPEELNRAIATGIPAVIRGVVWQVLAQSKNDDLEPVYHELVARGTDKEKDRHSGSSLSTSSNLSNLTVQREPVSSASSLHSAVDAQTNGASSGSPAADHKEHREVTEAALKAHQAAVMERKKREKEDKASLQRLEKTIRKDLGARTSYSKFAASQGLQESLYGVCKAYALFDEGVGYAQGMNFLVMPLLFNMPEEEAFCLLVRLMNHYQLRDLYVHDMPGLHKGLYQFERLLEDLEPALYCHLRRKGISPHLYATQWFLTLFAYRFPLQLVLRIYDLVLSEGLSAVLRFGIVLMQKNAANLLALSDMSSLTTFLRDRLFDVYIDSAPSAGGILENGFFGSSTSNMDKEVYRADQMVRDACDVRLTPELLASYIEEWEEQTASERRRDAEISRRDAEIDELRQANHASAVKVRRLEEQLQTVDAEQAEMATQLVHLKVENQELRDEGESLREQVKTLRALLLDQPTELEKAWQEERDSLMRRNEQVHEENQRVEKEMAELEEQLVQTKLLYAEINSQHETLTRRWTDLKRQFA